MLEYFYSNDVSAHGNVIFGMLPEEVAREEINYGVTDDGADE